MATRRVTWGATAVALALGTCVAASQLASRPAEDWIKTLEQPARVAALKVDDVVERMRLRPTDVVADLGAGSGLFEVALARAVPSGRVYAVELDDAYFPAIRAKATAAGVANVQTVKGQFTDAALPARDVDVAFFHDVLHHVEDRAAYLKNLVGYLEPGARIVVVEYTSADSPHKDTPALVVGREQGDRLMEAIGFVPAGEHALFTDKWFVEYRRR